MGLSPAGVADLVELGAKVLVEREAGAGAQIVLSREEVFRRADLICKVGRVSEEESLFLREGQTVTGFLHLITAPKALLKVLNERKITAISYEMIEEPHGRLPVLNPTSEIAGKMTPQLAGRFLERGRGTLLGGIPGIPPADVVILGGGTLGYNAARALRGVGANVYVLEKRPRRLEELDKYFAGSVLTVVSTRANIEVIHVLLFGKGAEDPLSRPDMEGHFRHNSLFVGPADREAVNTGRADYIPVFLSEIPGLLRQELPIDVALIHTSTPDEHGFLTCRRSPYQLLPGITSRSPKWIPRSCPPFRGSCPPFRATGKSGQLRLESVDNFARKTHCNRQECAESPY